MFRVLWIVCVIFVLLAGVLAYTAFAHDTPRILDGSEIHSEKVNQVQTGYDVMVSIKKLDSITRRHDGNYVSKYSYSQTTHYVEGSLEDAEAKANSLVNTNELRNVGDTRTTLLGIFDHYEDNPKPYHAHESVDGQAWNFTPIRDVEHIHVYYALGNDLATGTETHTHEFEDAAHTHGDRESSTLLEEPTAAQLEYLKTIGKELTGRTPRSLTATRGDGWIPSRQRVVSGGGGIGNAGKNGGGANTQTAKTANGDPTPVIDNVPVHGAVTPVPTLPPNVLRISYMSFNGFSVTLGLTAYSPDTQINGLVIRVKGHDFPIPDGFFGASTLGVGEMRTVKLTSRNRSTTKWVDMTCVSPANTVKVNHGHEIISTIRNRGYSLNTR